MRPVSSLMSLFIAPLGPQLVGNHLQGVLGLHSNDPRCDNVDFGTLNMYQSVPLLKASRGSPPPLVFLLVWSLSTLDGISSITM